MQNKEQLLSFEEPLRFIFSHSALVEGWDNPNVFTICNLQEGRTEMRKRQQIGRGLRLPVMDNGERCHVDDVNLLTVIAHEDFSKFAGDLQKEIEDETGVSFDRRIVDLRRTRSSSQLKEAGPRAIRSSEELWDRISRQTDLRARRSRPTTSSPRRCSASTRWSRWTRSSSGSRRPRSRWAATASATGATAARRGGGRRRPPAARRRRRADPAGPALAGDHRRGSSRRSTTSTR